MHVIFRSCIIIFILVQLFYAQEQADSTRINDQVLVKGGSLIIFPDSTLFIEKDSLIHIPSSVNYRIQNVSVKNPDFYDSLRVKASGNILTEWLYDAIFVSDQSSTVEQDFVTPENEYQMWDGMKIASIRLERVDVQSGSVTDTTQKAELGLSRFLNRVHIPTRDFVLKQNLLFETGDTVNSDLLADNERILRSLPYIEDARIYVRPMKMNDHEVEIIVVVKDIFSVGFNPTVTDFGKYRLEFFDKNLLGLGTELLYALNYDDTRSPPSGQEARYSMNNIRGSFISGLMQYQYIYGETFVRMNFEKEFLTPRTRYAGSLEMGRVSQKRWEMEFGDLVQVPYTFYYGDAWIGRAFQVDGENSRQTQVFSFRYRRDDVTSRPFVSPDSNRFYHDTELVLGSIIFRKSDYYKSSLIRSFGTTEDIPVGYQYKFTGGVVNGEFVEKPYLALEFFRSYVKAGTGYFGFGTGIGAFFYHDRWREGAVRFNSTYVAPLLKKQRFRFRNIVNFNMTFGIRPLDEAYVNIDSEVRGISDFGLLGKNKIAFSLESIAFTPWKPAGFRFAFYTFSDLGFLSEDRNFNRSDFYGSIGLGCRIRNESLVFKTLVLRFAVFPRIPGDEKHWKFDISSRDPRFFTSVSSSKPVIIPYE